MTQKELNESGKPRQFLLGEMSDEERIVFEEQFIADEAVFEVTRAAEDELIESYIRETLPDNEKVKFEANFLNTEKRRQRVAFTRAMLLKLSETMFLSTVKKNDASADTSLFTSVAAFFKAPTLAIGTASAFLLLIFAGWFFLRDQGRTEVVRQDTPTPPLTVPDQTQSTPPQVEPDGSSTTLAGNDNRNKVPNINSDAGDKNQNTQTPKQTISGPPPILALFAGTVRGGGKMAELGLPANAAGVRLQLYLESRDYKVYIAEIVDPDGRLISKAHDLKPAGRAVGLFVSASKLKPGDYIVKLFGLNQQKQTESVADYSFRVTRKQ